MWLLDFLSPSARTAKRDYLHAQKVLSNSIVREYSNAMDSLVMITLEKGNALTEEQFNEASSKALHSAMYPIGTDRAALSKDSLSTICLKVIDVEQRTRNILLLANHLV